jgi:toxin ParE1/3/4
LAKLEDCFDLLAENPAIGRNCARLLPGLRRFEVGKHVIFYQPEATGFFVMRVLYQQMIPGKSHFEP